MVQKVLGSCSVPSGVEVDEPQQTRKEGFEGQVPDKKASSLEVKLRWFGTLLSTRVLLLSPCFCLWLLFRTCEAGSFLFVFSQLSLNLSTDLDLPQYKESWRMKHGGRQERSHKGGVQDAEGGV